MRLASERRGLCESLCDCDTDARVRDSSRSQGRAAAFAVEVEWPLTHAEPQCVQRDDFAQDWFSATGGASTVVNN